MLGARDDRVLHGFRQINELRRIAGHTHEQIFIIFRMRLRVAQNLRGNAVELDMESAQAEQRLHHRAQVGLAALGGDEIVIETQVQKRATAVDLLIELGGGAHRCQRRRGVGADKWRHAFARWLAVFASARRGA